jgi:hypothetical protein
MDTSTLSRIVSLDGDIITVDFDVMGNMTPGEKLQAMIAAGKYDWVNPDITAKRFPVEGTGKKAFHTKLFHFGRYISSEDAVEAMKVEKLTPATHVHGLAFGAAFPEEQRNHPIACLGSSAQVYGGGRRVVCLGRNGDERYLNLWIGDWQGSWRFLAVREIAAG